MNQVTQPYTGLQVTLLALLPQDGTPVTVRSLAAATSLSEYQVTNAFFDLYLAHQVDYDVRIDAYSAPRPAAQGAA